MKLKYLILFPTILAGLSAGFTSCTDDFKEINSNKNKLYEPKLDDVFAGIVKNSADAWAELNYRRMLTFSRIAIVQSNSNPGMDRGSGVFTKFYKDIIRDMLLLERNYSTQTDADGRTVYPKNTAIIKIWKSYIFYTMASCYGPVPMSDCIVTSEETSKRYYKYDSEARIYEQILDELKGAVDLLDHTDNASANDYITCDLIYGNGGIPDINKWLRFANTLRLNVAMHCQNLCPDASREAALDVLSDGRLISDNSGNAIMQWGADTENSSSYYYRAFQKNHTIAQGAESPIWPCVSEYGYIYFSSFKDPRLDKYVMKMNERMPSADPYQATDTITRSHYGYCSDVDVRDSRGNVVSTPCRDYELHQTLSEDELKQLHDSIIINFTVDYVPNYESTDIPNSWQYALIPGTNNRYENILHAGRRQEWNHSVCRPYFVGENSHWVILTYADACFLRAEAEIIYNNNTAAAKTAYEAGIDASMSQWGITNYADFKNQDGVKWGTSYLGYHDYRNIYQAKIMGGENGSQGLLEQIYKQRSFADFFNGLEVWNIERRTRTFNWPPTFLKNTVSGVDGLDNNYNFWMERLIYPEDEYIKNQQANLEGLAMLQATSPFSRPDVRWGDNIYTSLGFAKKNPQLDDPDLWAYRDVVTSTEYYHHYYGATYEEILKKAKELAHTTDDAEALKHIAFKYQATKTFGYELVDYEQ